MEYNFGHFSGDGLEFVVTDPATPRGFDNYLWNDVALSNIQQTGTGFFDYQIGDLEAVQMLTGVGRICDYDVFGRDHLMSRLIYVRDNETGVFWNVNWEPVCREYDKYECTHGLGYTVIDMECEGIGASLRIFVPKGSDPVELWSLSFENTGEKERDLSVFVYNQFQFAFKWGFDSYGDMLFRSAELNRGINALVAKKYPYTRPHDYLTGFLTSDEPIAAFDGTRDSFVGLYSTLSAPQAVVRGHCGNVPGSSDATVGAVQFDIRIPKSGKKPISLILGATDDEGSIQAVKDKYLGCFDVYFERLRDENSRISELRRVLTPDEHLNRIMNGWLMHAALHGATWCRWGWMGYRDIVQHGMGVSALAPGRTREILLEAMRYQYANGLALRGWNPVDTKPYSDSALWLVFTLIAYLKETGDFAILEEDVPFFDSGSGTVSEHIRRVLDFFEENKGIHGLVLIKFGDWNDSLTAVGKEGRGESTWVSQAYAEALRQMAELYGHLGDERSVGAFLDRRRVIIEAINSNAWDGRWYTRCFDDRGSPIGSSSNKQGSIFMESQSWALISGTAGEERARCLIEACDELLLTEAGYRLLTPTFTKIDDNIGRISSMQPGICENGTVYSHPNIWMILGLLKLRDADKAYDIWKRVTPGYVKGSDDVKQKNPPYMYANGLYGPDHLNRPYQMEFTWITGSIAWFNTVIPNYMLGVRAGFGGLVIDPCVPSHWDKFSIRRACRGAVYDIAYENPGGLRDGSAAIEVDGLPLEGNVVPYYNDGGVHAVKVKMV